MNGFTGVPQGGIMIGATLVFAAFAWQAGMPKEPEQQCDSLRVIQYLPQIEPSPLIQTPPLGWPIAERARADDAEPVADKEQDVAEETPRRHRRYHRHRWR
jgi:hypothetical protein